MATTLPTSTPELTERTITSPPRVLSVDLLRGLAVLPRRSTTITP